MWNIPGLRIFRLSSFGSVAGVSCDSDGVYVGHVPLLRRICDAYGNAVWTRRDIALLNAELTLHYRLPVDCTGKLGGFTAVAQALNKGDLALARIATLHLQIPDLPPLHKGIGTEKEIYDLAIQLFRSGLLKADEEWNKKHPRTGEPPNPGWFAPKENEPNLPATRPQNNKPPSRWPSKETNRQVREWARKNLSIRHSPSLLAKLIYAFLKTIEPVDLNRGEDLITAQLFAAHDPPKTLQELQEPPRQYKIGYEQHHLVEQNDANRLRFGNDKIDDPENLVWIPRLKHEEITTEYNSRDPDDPLNRRLRDVVNEKTFDQQRERALGMLRKHGVLK